MGASWGMGGVHRRELFPVRLTERWDRLPGGLVESPSPETFKTRLDAVLCDLLEVFLLQRGRGIGLGELSRSLPIPNVRWVCAVAAPSRTRSHRAIREAALPRALGTRSR